MRERGVIETVTKIQASTYTIKLLQKSVQFIYLVKGTRVTRVKQQIFFFLILENTLIDGIKEAPLLGNFPYIGELF